MELVILTNKAENYNNVASNINITEVVQNYSTRLRAFIRKRVKNVGDTDDILQDVFFQLAESDRLLKPIDQMVSWLFTVARNRIIDLYRKKKTEPFPFRPDDDDMNIVDEIGEFIFDNGSNPETEFLRNLVWTNLDIALAELPPEQKLIFELTEIKGYSFKEISEQTGIPVNTLISRKHYAVMHLRERLKSLYDDLINI
jgi:RNA polymerase sigma factor (sigma-70 family)